MLSFGLHSWCLSKIWLYMARGSSKFTLCNAYRHLAFKQNLALNNLAFYRFRVNFFTMYRIQVIWFFYVRAGFFCDPAAFLAKMRTFVRKIDTPLCQPLGLLPGSGPAPIPCPIPVSSGKCGRFCSVFLPVLAGRLSPAPRFCRFQPFLGVLGPADDIFLILGAVRGF